MVQKTSRPTVSSKQKTRPSARSTKAPKPQPRRTKDVPTKGDGLSPRLFYFLRELAVHNERSWFAENKARYEADVRDPLLAFIEAFRPFLAKVSRQYVADARPVGGSLFRIHRDTRFSKDKTPYKTHAALHFRHKLADDVHTLGFYVHLEPNNAFMGAGIWRPGTETLQRIREEIMQKPKAWLAAKKSVEHHFEFAGESLKRPPRGFDKSHPLIRDLAYKDFILIRKVSERAATSPLFVETLAKDCQMSTPFMKFLSRATGIPW